MARQSKKEIRAVENKSAPLCSKFSHQTVLVIQITGDIVPLKNAHKSVKAAQSQDTGYKRVHPLMITLWTRQSIFGAIYVLTR